MPSHTFQASLQPRFAPRRSAVAGKQSPGKEEGLGLVRGGGLGLSSGAQGEGCSPKAKQGAQHPELRLLPLSPSLGLSHSCFNGNHVFRHFAYCEFFLFHSAVL